MQDMKVNGQTVECDLGVDSTDVPIAKYEGYTFINTGFDNKKYGKKPLLQYSDGQGFWMAYTDAGKYPKAKKIS